MSINENGDKENSFHPSNSAHLRVPFGLQALNTQNSEGFSERCKRCDALKNECINLREDNERFRVEHRRLEETNNRLNGEVDVKSRQLEHAESELAKIRNKGSYSDDQIQVILSENRELQQRLLKLNQQCSSLEIQNRTTKEDIIGSADLSKNLQHHIDELRDALDTQSQQVASLTSELSAKNNTLLNRDELIMDLQAQIKKSTIRSSMSPSGRVSCGSDDLETIRISAELAREENYNLQQEIQNLRQRIDHNHNSLDSANSEIRQRNTIISDLNAEIMSLRNLIDQSGSLKEELQKVSVQKSQSEEALKRKRDEISDLSAELDRMQFKCDEMHQKEQHQKQELYEGMSLRELLQKKMDEAKRKLDESHRICQKAQEREKRAAEKAQRLERDLKLEHKTAKKRLKDLDERYHHENYKKKYAVSVKRIQYLESVLSTFFETAKEMENLTEEEFALHREFMKCNQSFEGRTSAVASKILSVKNEAEQKMEAQRQLIKAEFQKLAEELAFICERLNDISIDFGPEAAISSLWDISNRIAGEQGFDIQMNNVDRSPHGRIEGSQNDRNELEKMKKYIHNVVTAYYKKHESAVDQQKEIREAKSKRKVAASRMDWQLDSHKLPDFEDSNETKRNLEQKLRQADSKITTLKTTIRELRTQCDVLQKAGVDFQESSLRFEKRFEEERRKCEKLCEEIKKQKNEIFSFKKRNGAMLDAMKSVESSKENLRATLKDRDSCLTQTQDRLKQCKSHYQSKMQSLKQKLHADQTKNDEYQHLLKREHDLQNQIQQFRKLVAERNSVITELETEKETLRRQSSHSTSSYSELSKHCEAQTAKLFSAEKQLRKLEEDRNNLLAKYQSQSTVDEDDPSDIHSALRRAFKAEKSMHDLKRKLEEKDKSLRAQSTWLEKHQERISELTKQKKTLKEEMKAYYNKGNERIKAQYLRGKKLYQFVKFIHEELEKSLPILQQYDIESVIELYHSVLQFIEKQSEANRSTSSKLETPQRRLVTQTPTVSGTSAVGDNRHLLPPRHPLRPPARGTSSSSSSSFSRSFGSMNDHIGAGRLQRTVPSFSASAGLSTPVRTTRSYVNDWLSTPTLTHSRSKTSNLSGQSKTYI